MKPSEQQDYYRALWENRSPINEDERHRAFEIVQILRSLSGSGNAGAISATPAILDLGCGTGWLGRFLAAYGKVHAGDFEERTIRAAAENYPEVKFHLLRDGQPCYGLDTGSFDVVISSEVIEHVEDKRAFVRTIHDLLRPGGHLVLTTPRGEYFEQWSRWVRGEHQPVEEWISSRELRSLVSRGGFEVVRHRSFYLIQTKKSFLNARLIALARRVPLVCHIFRRLTDPWGIYQILLARKSPEPAAPVNQP